MSIRYDSTAHSMVLSGANELNPVLRVPVGIKTNDETGTETPAYASVKVPGRPTDRTGALAALAAMPDVLLGKPNLQRLTWPKDAVPALQLTISPRMTGSRIAVLFCVLSGRKIPIFLSNERIAEHLTALGQSALIPAYCPGMTATEPAATEPAATEPAATEPAATEPALNGNDKPHKSRNRLQTTASGS